MSRIAIALAVAAIIGTTVHPAAAAFVGSSVTVQGGETFTVAGCSYQGVSGSCPGNAVMVADGSDLGVVIESSVAGALLSATTGNGEDMSVTLDVTYASLVQVTGISATLTGSASPGGLANELDVASGETALFGTSSKPGPSVTLLHPTATTTFTGLNPLTSFTLTKDLKANATSSVSGTTLQFTSIGQVVSFSAVRVPEPASTAIFLTASLATVMVGRRRRR